MAWTDEASPENSSAWAFYFGGPIQSGVRMTPGSASWVEMRCELACFVVRDPREPKKN